MKRNAQIELARRLLAYQERPAASLARELEWNDKTVYTAPGQHKAEHETLFRHHPLVVAASCQLRAPGAFVTTDLAGLPVLVVRGRDGQARAFRNICRHRGATVAEEPCGRRLSFACPYHGWVYDTEGHLMAIPEHGYGFAGLDTEAMGLSALPTAERHGLIWALPQGDEPLEIDAYLGPLGEELAAYGFADYQHFQSETRECPMNWKLVSDGFWEGYHLKVLHKRTIDPIFDGRVTAFDAYGRHHRMAVPRRTLSALREQPEARWEVLPRVIVLYSLFPNTVWVMQGDHVEMTRIFPGAHPAQCRVEFSLFTPEPVTSESAQRHWARNMEMLLATVEQEDFRVARGIQAGAEAGEPRWQVLSRYEPALAHFHRSVRLALGQPATLHPSAGAPSSAPRPRNRRAG